ncbi:hypothetical protein [Melittangium boletus]|uniref:Lipoprotein n=1 Tax=Melittangium boletus DSM 14713 TaxID=1294270 RepID=A0A250IPH6_9BACT|nr:hypothetical protein [Melittangium boletus]ATB33655.1 hypothetical protein MEBOL_007153 [Melittangium boletus DSM 14713]
MRANIFGGVLGVALLAAGCGAPVENPETETAPLSTREDALPACNGEAYERAFYSDASKTNQVGGWECWCGSSSAYIWGRTTAFSEYLYVNQCRVQP